MIDTIGIHRGRNSKSVAISRAITDIDYNFDFRGFYGQSKLNPLWLLLKAWITSKEIPQARNYFIEGGMVFWVGFFLKRRYKNAKLFLMVPEPAFYLDEKKSFLQKRFFDFKIKMMKKYVDHYFLISKMVACDAKKLIGNDIKYSILRHYINNITNFKIDKNIKKGNNILFVIERPGDTGYVKGLDLVINIFNSVQKEISDVKLFLAGSGTETLRYDDKNIVCLGFCDMPRIFNECKILIAPARYDAFLIVVAEACMSGVLPLVSQNVGMKEFLPDQLVINLLDTNKWSRAIIDFLKTDDLEIYDICESLKNDFLHLNQDEIIRSFVVEYSKLSKH